MSWHCLWEWEQGGSTRGTHLAVGRAVMDRRWLREVMGCDRAMGDVWWVGPEVSGCVEYGQGGKSPVRGKEQVTMGTRGNKREGGQGVRSMSSGCGCGLWSCSEVRKRLSSDEKCSHSTPCEWSHWHLGWG